eukprot:IDg6766t1
MRDLGISWVVRWIDSHVFAFWMRSASCGAKPAAQHCGWQALSSGGFLSSALLTSGFSRRLSQEPPMLCYRKSPPARSCPSARSTERTASPLHALCTKLIS